MRLPLNNIAPYLGVVPTAALTVAAAADPDPEIGRQVIELGFALLSLAASLVIPWIIQKIRRLAHEIRSTPSNQDVSSLAAKIGELEVLISNLQHEIKVTAQDRDRLAKESQEKDDIFQETILKLKNDSFEQVQSLTRQLADERELNSNLSRQYDQLVEDLKSLRQQVDSLQGMNALAEMIRKDIRTLLEGA